LESPIYSVWGIPVLPDFKMLDGSVKKKGDGFVRGLCWFNTGDAGSRRDGFPSWSWAGWHWRGTFNAQWRNKPNGRGYRYFWPESIGVEFLTDEEKVIDGANINQLRPESYAELSPFILLNCEALPIQINFSSETPSKTWYMNFDLLVDDKEVWRQYGSRWYCDDCKLDLKQLRAINAFSTDNLGEVAGIYMGYEDEDNKRERHQFLVISRVDGHSSQWDMDCWERVGILEFEFEIRNYRPTMGSTLPLRRHKILLR